MMNTTKKCYNDGDTFILDSFKQWALSIADKARENTQDIIGQF